MRRVTILIGLKVGEIAFILSLAWPGNWLANRFNYPVTIGPIDSWSAYGLSWLAFILWVGLFCGIIIALILIVFGLYTGIEANWKIAKRISRRK